MNLKCLNTISRGVGVALLLGTALLSVSCRHKTLQEEIYDPDGHTYWHPGMQSCVFNIWAGSHVDTKATGVTYADESAINRWGLYIFDSSQNYVASASSSAGQGVQKFLAPGTYTICAVVNYPVSGSYALNPAVKGNINTLSSLAGYVPRLEDMAENNIMMYGTETLTLTAGASVEKTVDVRRLVCKAGIKKITLDWENPGHGEETFTLKHIYMTNAYGLQLLGADVALGSLSGARGDWFNTMGYHTSGSRSATAAADAMLADRDINLTLADGESSSVEHYFYPFPNPVAAGSDSRSATWSVRSTCMVIEATVGGLTYYYRIQIPSVMQRNKTYIADEVIIRNLGSLDPEQDVTNSMTVRFGFTTSWDNVNVTENS